MIKHITAISIALILLLTGCVSGSDKNTGQAETIGEEGGQEYDTRYTIFKGGL